MNIVAILASPHGIKGNTSVLASWLLYEAEQEGARIAGVSLSDCAVEPCLGCDKCVGTEDCPMGDDFAAIARAIGRADGVVLISPMHFFGCSALMMTLIDRSRSILLRQHWRGKWGAVVMTSAGTDCRQAVAYLEGFMHACGCWTVGSVHASLSQWRNENEKERSFRAARLLGHRLVRAIRSHEEFEDQRPEVEAYAGHLQCIGASGALAPNARPGNWTRWEKAG